MSAEVVSLRPATAPVAAETPLPGPLAVPPHVVAAIARAAVEAYKQQERERRNAAARAYYRANREAVLEQQREYRERTRRRHQVR